MNNTYRGERLSRVAFPMGGMGAGMIGLEGNGCLSHVSLRHRPDVYNEPAVFSAVCVKGVPGGARVLEGPVPAWKVFGTAGTGNGGSGRLYGLPRFGGAEFSWRFPFGTVALSDPALPLGVTITGWSPFVPLDADSASLPVAGLEFTFTNRTRKPLRAVYSFNARNFLGVSKGRPSVRAVRGGFVLEEAGPADAPWERAAFCAVSLEAGTKVNPAWFRGGWFDPNTMAWKDVAAGLCADRAPHEGGDPSPGASLMVQLALAAGASKTVRLLLAWYAPETRLTVGGPEAAIQARGADACYKPWYAGRFASIDDVAAFWRREYAGLRKRTLAFTDCFYDTTLPAEAVEAAAANLTILKSPTVLRQADGRLWGWEGCCDGNGCCHGTCTHVWNYAQALPHLFPALERGLRETEFGESQDARGHQNFRAALPIQTVEHGFHAAADGQLGGIMKVHREWRISGDTAWMAALWPKVKASLDYCMATWDPQGGGVLVEPHHNTYDIEFWGPDGMCTSFYLGALRAAVEMGRAAGADVWGYETVLARGREHMESRLFNGEYFEQHVQWKGLRAADPTTAPSMMTHYTPEARAVLEKEGPKYQYGRGCLADGVLGAWLAEMCGVPAPLDAALVRSHLVAVHRHNLKRDLSAHANPQRPTFALGREGGLLLCTWPRGGKLSLPFPYSDEVWTGIEYQVASHLILAGEARKGLEIVRVARKRFDGRVRNPFNEYECGHWYARAMASYGLLTALSGARYDAVDQTLHLRPPVKGDFRAFVCTATGYGTVGLRKGKPFVEVRSGRIPVKRVVR